ncbi:hypothetical protein K7X08_027308 [Anisodus acutangulus]|uniref:Gnk2-homologous domain-containing protein n=1 Tax=Anisodus acutangulus TaxID=402998 RepID=A0A9Q1RI44_9SOLA|nr:hypothetical protein K7X08_027308 [Anisodus acutangulus]
MCSKSGNFTANSYYAQNLKNLLGDLYLKTPLTGFSTSSIGQNYDQTNGLSLCRGDVSSDNCKSCVLDASEELGKRCPYDKEAIIWYDNCLLKYSDKDFLGKIDNTYKFYMWNLRVVSKPEYFNAKTKELLGNLAENAYKKKNLYATGEMEIEENKKLNGLVQCTRDISNEDCKKCLDGIITELPSCCDGKEGGRVDSGDSFMELWGANIRQKDLLFEFAYNQFSSQTASLRFSASSIGQKPDRSHGLSLCRGDVSSDDCKSCILDASQELGKRCPYDKEAIIWYDSCLLKYSDDCFRGEIDNRYKFYMWNVAVVSKPEYFNSKMRELLGSLIDEAYWVQDLYATGEMKIGENEKLYGLVQCTKDISNEECKKCLEVIVTELPHCCDGQKGGRDVGGSCNFRYEMYPFFNTP